MHEMRNAWLDRQLPPPEALNEGAVVHSILPDMLGSVDYPDGRRFSLSNPTTYLTLDRCVADLNNHAAAYRIFPIRFREGQQFTQTWPYPGRLPSGAFVDNYFPYGDYALDDYEKRTGRQVDYLLIYSRTTPLAMNILPSPIAIEHLHFNQGKAEALNARMADITQHGWTRIHQKSDRAAVVSLYERNQD
jgi:hypothetical protein